jgi:hypothetical protein
VHPLFHIVQYLQHGTSLGWLTQRVRDSIKLAMEHPIGVQYACVEPPFPLADFVRFLPGVRVAMVLSWSRDDVYHFLEGVCGTRAADRIGRTGMDVRRLLYDPVVPCLPEQEASAARTPHDTAHRLDIALVARTHFMDCLCSLAVGEVVCGGIASAGFNS